MQHCAQYPYQLHLVSILKWLRAILKGKTRLATTLALVESNSTSAILCVTIPGIEQKKKFAQNNVPNVAPCVRGFILFLNASP